MHAQKRQEGRDLLLPYDVLFFSVLSFPSILVLPCIKSLLSHFLFYYSSSVA